MSFGIDIFSNKGLLYSSDSDQAPFFLVVDWFVAQGGTDYHKSYLDTVLSNLPLSVLVFNGYFHTITSTGSTITLTKINNNTSTSCIVVVLAS